MPGAVLSTETLACQTKIYQYLPQSQCSRFLHSEPTCWLHRSTFPSLDQWLLCSSWGLSRLDVGLQQTPSPSPPARAAEDLDMESPKLAPDPFLLLPPIRFTEALLRLSIKRLSTNSVHVHLNWVHLHNPELCDCSSKRRSVGKGLPFLPLEMFALLVAVHGMESGSAGELCTSGLKFEEKMKSIVTQDDTTRHYVKHPFIVVHKAMNHLQRQCKQRIVIPMAPLADCHNLPCPCCLFGNCTDLSETNNYFKLQPHMFHLGEVRTHALHHYRRACKATCNRICQPGHE